MPRQTSLCRLFFVAKRINYQEQEAMRLSSSLERPIVRFSIYSWLMALLLIGAQSFATDYLVTSASQISALNPQPGDNIILADGTWTDQHIVLTGTGTSSNPITLRAQTPGGVTLNGTSRLSIGGDWLVADGLNFDGGALSSGHVVEFRNGSNHATNSRFTNSAIVDYNPADVDTRYFWVSMYGDSNRVDHNYFSGQNHSGVTVTVWRDNTDADNHLIDNNYFSRPAPINPSSTNGFETVRIGTSDESLSDSFTVVQNNLFEQANGEIEIISNKSGNNSFLYNTFRESEGTLTLRHGNDNLVQGNFFLGEGKDNSGGVRVIGERQTIVNNYFHDLDGRAEAAIAITAGESSPALTGYYPVVDALIAHNTIVDVNRAAITFDQGLGSSGRTELADNVTIANNIIDSFQDPVFEGSQGTGWLWEGNIVNAGSLGSVSSMPGITQVDPQLSADANGIFRLTSSSSPAVDAAAGNYSSVITDDMDGQPRIGLFDVGADELSSATISRIPLNSDDVGPDWLNTPPPTFSGCNLNGCAIQAEDYTSILDPNGDLEIWSVESATDALGGQVLKATDGGFVSLPSEDHDTIAVFELEFQTAGTYTFYHRARGFSSSTNSIYTPDDFDTDPDNNETVSSNSMFEWREETFTFSISQANVGVPLEFRLGMRESLSELDAIVLHLDSSLSDAELDALFAPLVGDFNGDGVVDSADYTVWRDTLGQTGSGLAADADGNGVVDNSDYTLWSTSYGATNGLSSSASSSQAVPEPVNVFAMLIGLLCSINAKRRSPVSVSNYMHL